MPGYTHMQPAQPVTFGHHLLAYVEMFARDRGRFEDARKRLNESPLGAAALAGTSFPIDRDVTAHERWASPGRCAIPWTRSRRAISRWNIWRPAAILRRQPVAAGGRAGAMVDARFRLREIVGRFHHRLLHHAAEAQSRCRRTDPGQDRPGAGRFRRAGDRGQGPGADLWHRPAGRQGTGVRRRRHDRAFAWRRWRR